MPLSFRTTFTYRPYSIGGGGPPPRVSRPRESHGAIEFVSLREPTESPLVTLGSVKLNVNTENGGGRVKGYPPVRLSPKNGTRDDFPRILFLFEIQGEGRRGR